MIEDSRYINLENRIKPNRVQNNICLAQTFFFKLLFKLVLETWNKIIKNARNSVSWYYTKQLFDYIESPQWLNNFSDKGTYLFSTSNPNLFVWGKYHTIFSGHVTGVSINIVGVFKFHLYAFWFSEISLPDREFELRFHMWYFSYMYCRLILNWSWSIDRIYMYMYHIRRMSKLIRTAPQPTKNFKLPCKS